MTSRPGQAITFNEVGKVSKVVSGSAVQDTVYNVDGSILLRKSTVEGASLFVGDTVLSQAPGSSVVSGFRTYSGAQGKPVAQRSAKTGTTGTTMTWLFSNLEGTVDVQTVANSTGVTTRMLRDPYGAPIGSSGVWSSGTGYMDKPATASTGLTTVGARTYDPVLGKFLSVDPVIDTNLPQQNTGYTYSGNNPTTYMDPTGLRLSIGCEPNCPKGSATIAQKLTPRGTQARADTRSVSDYTHGLYKSWIKSKDNKSILNTAKNDGEAFRGVIYSAILARKGFGSGYIALALDYVGRRGATDSALKMYTNFKTGGKWDAKPGIFEEFRYRGYEYSASSEGVSVRTDVYGNVIYGAMLASYGITEYTAIEASNLSGSDVGAGIDSTDDAAVSLGYELYAKYPDGATSQQYFDLIKSHCEELACR